MTDTTTEKVLEVKNVTLKFGGLTALDDVSFDIRRGEILGLIGPNGAGKTTCFNVMTGVYKQTSGEVTLPRQVAQLDASASRSPSSASPARSRTSGSSGR